MTRGFNAPRRLVWDAWTKPEFVARWFGADGWTVPVCEIDLRLGRTYGYVMRSSDGQEVTMRGVYRDVAAPERLVTTEVFEGFSEVGYRPEDETVSTAVLTERDADGRGNERLTRPARRDPGNDGVGAAKIGKGTLENAEDRTVLMVR